MCYFYNAEINRLKTSQQLVSHDIHNNKFQYKHTFSVEIAPISKVSSKSLLLLFIEHLSIRMTWFVYH